MVNLITRPRRFGKTLTLSTLAEFLDIQKDSRKLFEGLEIFGYPDLCKKMDEPMAGAFSDFKRYKRKNI